MQMSTTPRAARASANRRSTSASTVRSACAIGAPSSPPRAPARAPRPGGNGRGHARPRPRTHARRPSRSRRTHRSRALLVPEARRRCGVGYSGARPRHLRHGGHRRDRGGSRRPAASRSSRRAASSTPRRSTRPCAARRRRERRRSSSWTATAPGRVDQLAQPRPGGLDPACEYVVQDSWTEYTEPRAGLRRGALRRNASRAGTAQGVMNHTISGRDYQNLWFNDVLVGETGINAALCGTWGCPVLLVTGRRRAPSARAARRRLTTVPVKRGLARAPHACSRLPARGS